MDYIYPLLPQSIDSSMTQLRGAYRKQVIATFASILLFFFVYLLLIIGSLLLLFACCVLAYFLVSAVHHFIALMLGLGLIGFGVMFTYFLVKFIFAVSKPNTGSSIQIEPGDQPELYFFIKRLTAETQTNFPNKIVVAPDVNAAVFYNSSFWSMFFPVRKNLMIGLGLVNSLTVSEFKAVLAHEFGHFSQRSMKLGSFVYNVNRVIYNMLYDNEGYGKSLQRFANMSSYFSIFARMTVNLVEGVQDVLKKMYAVVNKRYMALSREMEFHADAVSASVSGSEAGIRALRKTGLSDMCYNSVLHKCDEWIKENKYAFNIYNKHRVLMQFVAEANHIPMKDGLPAPDGLWHGSIPSRLTVKDQWASHPTTEERITRLNDLHVKAELNNASAWVLFSKASLLQEQMTEKIHKTVVYDGERQPVNDESYRSELKANAAKYSLPEVFKGYYDDRQIEGFIPAFVANENTYNFEQLINDETCILYKRIQRNKSDILLLEHIRKKESGIRTFDYDGVKYDSWQVEIILDPLRKETGELEEKLKATDKALFMFFYGLAKNVDEQRAKQLENLYFSYFHDHTQDKELYELAEGAMKLMQDIFNGMTIQVPVINSTIETLKEKYEAGLKDKLQQYLDKGAFDEFWNLKKSVSGFIQSDYIYFSVGYFKNEELAHLLEVLRGVFEMRAEAKFKILKSILLDQEGLLHRAAQTA